MRLEHCHQATLMNTAGSLNGCGHLCWVMGIIVNHLNVIYIAQQLETPSGSTKLNQTSSNLIKGHTQF